MDEKLKQTTQGLKAGLECIYKTYGFEHQLNKLVEECSELIQAVARYQNAPCSSTYRQILEEFCDVTNVGDQLMLFKPQGFLGVEFRVKKIQRELMRIIESEKKEKQ